MRLLAVFRRRFFRRRFLALLRRFSPISAAFPPK
jgi:hypothetical protein